EIVKVLPLGVMVTFDPADKRTLSNKPLKLLTACPDAIFAAVTELSASWFVPTPLFAIPSGRAVVPSPVSDVLWATVDKNCAAARATEVPANGKFAIPIPTIKANTTNIATLNRLLIFIWFSSYFPCFVKHPQGYMGTSGFRVGHFGYGSVPIT